MTDTTTGDNTAPQPPSGTLEHLDPHGLAIGDNVRDNTAPSPEFLDSIQQHGVLVPITAVRGHDGTVTVRNGSLSSSVLLSIRVARRSAAVAVIGQGEITRWIQRYREGSVWVVMAARMRRPLGGSFSIVLGRCLRLSSTMRSHGRIGVCWSGRRDGCAMVSRFSSGRVGWSMSG